ncbi:MAG: acetyl esterase/lipase [Paraglaciecola sp.]|jgi:acetyl esterase/lipase
MRIFALALLCVLLGACVHRPQKIDRPEVPANLSSDVSYKSVTALTYEPAEVKLAYGEGPLQYGLLWLPEHERPGEPAPLVIFVHGGCWLNVYDINHSNAFSSALSQAGYAVWSIEYRRSGDVGGGWPGSLNDVLRGISFAQSFNDYPIDLTQVVITGHSAGGHLALLAGAADKHAFVNGNAVKAVVGLAAISDIGTYSLGDNSCQTAVSQFMGGDYSDNSDDYQQATPNVRSLPGRSLLLQGDGDNIVPVSQASNSQFEHLIVPGAGHFDWIHPQTHAFKLFLLQLEALFNQ